METHLCNRCGYDEVDPEAKVADFFQDWFLSICAGCAAQLHNRQAKMDDY